MEVAQWLDSMGVPIDGRNNSGCSALQGAAHGGFLKVRLFCFCLFFLVYCWSFCLSENCFLLFLAGFYKARPLKSCMTSNLNLLVIIWPIYV